MTNFTNETKATQKIYQRLNQLKDFLGVDKSILLLIDLYYLVTILPVNELNRFISSVQLEEKVEVLSKHLSKYSPTGAVRNHECRQFVEDIGQLDINVTKSLFNSILQDDLSGIEVSESLLEVAQQSWGKKGGGFAGMPLEVAKLSQLLLDVDSKNRTALCLGFLANAEALLSAQKIETRYELYGLGVGRSIRNKIFVISGLKIDYPDLTTPDTITVDIQKYSCGYLSDAWGMKNRIFGWDENRFASISSEVSKLESMIERVNGKIVCAVPSGFLFKTSGDDAQLKRFLLKEGLIESVIQLPDRILSHTAIAPALLIINTQSKSDSVQFIDASGDEFRKVESRSLIKLKNVEQILDVFTKRSESGISEIKPIDEILSKDVNLDVKRYVKSNDQLALENSLNAYEKQISLGEIAELISCQAIKVSDEEGDTLTELGPININSTGGVTHNSQFKHYVPDAGLHKRIVTQTLRTNDIVFTIKGTLGKCALVTEEQAGMIASQSFCIIRLKAGSVIKSPQILLRYLLSDLGKLMIENLSSGATVKMLKMKDLQSLIVPVPAIEQQSEIEQNYQDVLGFAEQIKSLEEQIDQKMKQYWSI